MAAASSDLLLDLRPGKSEEFVMEITGLEGKVAVVTGAGRMRSIGRPIAVELARAGCDVVLTGTGRAADRYPEHEQVVGRPGRAHQVVVASGLGDGQLALHLTRVEVDDADDPGR